VKKLSPKLEEPKIKLGGSCARFRLQIWWGIKATARRIQHTAWHQSINELINQNTFVTVPYDANNQRHN